MAERKPLKLVDLGQGLGEIREFSEDDTLPESAVTGTLSDAPASTTLPVTGGPATFLALIQILRNNLKAIFTGSFFSGATSKATPVDADSLVMVDSASNNLFRMTFANLWTWVASKFAGLAVKTALVDADGVVITDSAASGVAKLMTWANFVNAMRTRNGPQPLVYAERSANQTLTNGEYAVVVFNSATLNANNWYSTSTGRFTPLRAGRYLISVSGIFSGESATIFLLGCFKNGVSYRRFGQINFTLGTITDYTTSGSCVMELNGSTDYADIRAVIYANSNPRIIPGTTVDIVYLGA